MRRTCERSGPERRDTGGLPCGLQPPQVPPEGLEVGEQVRGEQDRLCALKMRVARENEIPVFLCHLDERAHRGEHTDSYPFGRRVHVLVREIPRKRTLLDLP